ncbi:MAG: hypothetical protein ACK4MF_11845, partial [Hyphomicrobiaceae bacterium]
MSSLSSDIARYARTMPHLPTILTFLLALAATGISAWVTMNVARQATQNSVRSETASIRVIIVDVVLSYEQVLKSSAGFVNAAAST